MLWPSSLLRRVLFQSARAGSLMPLDLSMLPFLAPYLIRFGALALQVGVKDRYAALLSGVTVTCLQADHGWVLIWECILTETGQFFPYGCC
jgi:hypothetical protein